MKISTQITLEKEDSLVLAESIEFLKNLDEKLEETMKSKGKNILGRIFSDFFAKYPEAKKIVWAQYAPSFNDGAPCIFEVHEADLHPDLEIVRPELKEKFLEIWGDEGEYDEESYNHGELDFFAIDLDFVFSDRELEMKKDWEKIRKVFRFEKLFESVFGPDARVIATKKGFEMDYINHY